MVKSEVLRKTIEILTSEKSAFSEARAEALRDVVSEYKATAMYKTELLVTLKPEIKKNLAFLHDYKQFVARVKQNINVVLQTRFPNDPLEVQLQKASKSEAAIYWSAALMDDKLQNVLLLTEPDRLAGAKRTPFRLHGLILKLIRIYSSAFDEKNVVVVQNGASTGEITAPQAFTVIPHAFLDNALKYSSRDSRVMVGFKEDQKSIEFSVTSHGPKIEANEMTKIFELFKRGAAGVAQHEEGSGIGLYLAQFVAHDLGTEIKVWQSPQKTKSGYETVFSVTLVRTD
jgi:signal transduction histidine kinase